MDLIDLSGDTHAHIVIVIIIIAPITSFSSLPLSFRSSSPPQTTLQAHSLFLSIFATNEQSTELYFLHFSYTEPSTAAVCYFPLPSAIFDPPLPCHRHQFNDSILISHSANTTGTTQFVELEIDLFSMAKATKTSVLPIVGESPLCSLQPLRFFMYGIAYAFSYAA